MLKIGIIGCGGIVERRHLPGILELSHQMRICALSDISPKRLSHIGDKADVITEHQYADYCDLIENETLDLLIIATPLSEHEGAIIAAAGRVPTILVEKPLAVDLDSAVRMKTLCENRGTQLGIVHNQLFRPAVIETRQLLSTGEYGKPFLYRDELWGASHRVGSGHEQNWRTQRSNGGGGCLIDNAYHSIYLAEHLLGSPVVTVQAQVDTFIHNYDVEDTALAIMRHSNGALSTIQSGWSIAAGRYVAGRIFELHSSKASFIFDHGENPLAVIRAAEGTRETPNIDREREDDAGFFNFRDVFFNALIEGNPIPSQASDGCHVLEVIECAYKSAKSGATQSVSGHFSS